MSDRIETQSDEFSLPDDRARQLLAFAAAHPNLARYVLLLHRLIDTQQALTIDPILTHRLRRTRDEATAEHARRLGTAH